jgi:flagellar biogenesis protein FliO
VNLQHVRKTGSVAPRQFGPGGLAGWLLARLRNMGCGLGKETPKLALVERITLAPRQTLALVEAEGRRFLVASSAEGAPAFFALDRGRVESGTLKQARGAKARVSW